MRLINNEVLVFKNSPDAVFFSRAATDYKIPDEINTLGSYALYNFSTLVSLDLNNVYSVDWYALAGCTSLTLLTADRLRSLGPCCLTGCSSLTALTLPSVTYIGSSGSGTYPLPAELTALTIGSAELSENIRFGQYSFGDSEGSISSLTVYGKLIPVNQLSVCLSFSAAASVIAFFNALSDEAPVFSGTNAEITIRQSLYNALSQADINIAVNKGYTVSGQ